MLIKKIKPNQSIYGLSDLKTGNLPVSRLCLYCLSQMIVGLEKVALYRAKEISNPLSTSTLWAKADD
ncbi:fruit protein [Trifolium repens]|nr:fruit protein [Trifolium repens]